MQQVCCPSLLFAGYINHVARTKTQLYPCGIALPATHIPSIGTQNPNRFVINYAPRRSHNKSINVAIRNFLYVPRWRRVFCVRCLLCLVFVAFFCGFLGFLFWYFLHTHLTHFFVCLATACAKLLHKKLEPKGIEADWKRAEQSLKFVCLSNCLYICLMCM